MENAKDYRMAFVTVKSYDDAYQIMKILITESLAACCTVIQNCISMFGWQGAVQERHEYLILIKTSSIKLGEMEKRIIELHHDDAPEIIAIELDSSSKPYLEWLQQATTIK